MISAVRNKTTYSLFDKIYLSYIFIYANIFISPLFAIIPIPVWKILTLLAFLLLFVSYKSGKRINKIFLYLIIATITISCIPAVYRQDISPVIRNISFILVLALFCYFDDKYIEPFITYSTIFICLNLAGAYIGFLYALAGGKPLFEYYGPQENLQYFYLTTSVRHVAVVGRFIRPGGIYDEPGSLSTFICSICLLRTLYKRSENKTLLIMIAGMVTFSLFHLAVLFCYSMHYIKNNIRKKLTWVFIVILSLLVVCLGIVFHEVLEIYLYNRLKINSSGRLAGNTREQATAAALGLINEHSFFWGLDDIYTNLKKYPFFNDTPFTLLARYGIFVTWYYYVFLLFVFICALIKKKLFFIFFAMLLVFLPHPYPDVLSYSFYFVLFFYCALKAFKNQFPKEFRICKAYI